MPNPVTINLSFTEMLQFAVALIVLVSGVLAILYSIWGGFLLITSGGNEEKVKPAVNHIRHAFLGLIVLILILFVTPKVLALLGLPFADDLRASNIFSKMSEVSSSLFGTRGTSDTVLDDGANPDSLPSDFSDL